MPLLRPFTLALLVGALCPAVYAAPPATETKIVRVPRAAHSSPAAARTFEARLAGAALEVCGAAPHSFSEVKRAVKKSQCWHDAYGDAITRFRDGGTATRLSSLPSGGEIGKP